MSSYYHYNGHQHHATTAGNAHHGGRNRRAPRLSMSQNAHRQLRQPRSAKELLDSVNLATFRLKFEAGRSFDLEDDMEFCPGLLTETDVSSPPAPPCACECERDPAVALPAAAAVPPPCRLSSPEQMG